MEIPIALLDQIKQGNVVLFLGAGASFGATHPKFQKIPLGNELSNMIANKFLDNDYKDHQLHYVSEIAISETDLFTVQNYLFELFEPFEPAEYHKKIKNFTWKTIVTTNYDYIIEKAYKGKSHQNLKRIIKDGQRIRDIIKTQEDLPFYKIHGCISEINDKDLPLILTPEQYITHKKNRERLFSRIQDLSKEYTFLFVGFSFADPDIRAIFLELDSLIDAKPRSYMIGPNIKDPDARFWDQKKITSIKCTFENFLIELENKIDINYRKIALAKPLTSNIHKVFEKSVININDLKPSDNLVNYLNNDLEYIHSTFAESNTEPKQFYKGYFNNWDPIIKGYDSKRNIIDTILLEIFLKDNLHNGNELNFYMLLGYAGSGKSVSIKRLCWQASTELDRICLFFKSNSLIRAEPIIELYNYLKERIYLFIDDVSDYNEELILFINKIKNENIPITIFGTERINTWNVDCNELSLLLDDYYQLEYLNDREIQSLLDKLEQYDSLGYLKGKKLEERVKALSYRAGRELLVALYESTMGKPFTEIVVDEYNSISNVTAKSVYLTVSILHRLGSVARAGLISRVNYISFTQFKEKLHKPLEFIVFDKKDNKINDIVYVTRHRQIAEIIFSEVLKDKQLKFDEYNRILNCLDVDYENDRIPFLAMINAKNLMELFSDPNMIRELYKTAIKRNPNDAKLLQQFAIFEINGKGGSIYESEKILKEANELSKNDRLINHSFIELSINKAERAKNKLEKNRFLLDAEKAANILKNKFKENPHTYHSLIKIKLIKLKDILEDGDVPTIERLIKETEELFNHAKQKFPYQEFILESESNFNKILNNAPEAIALLEEAYSLNKRSPYLSLRLANLYEQNNDCSKAIEILGETLNYLPNDKDVNFKYAQLLIVNKSDDLECIRHHLNRSFTRGDNRIQAQFWYGRTLYLMNNITESDEIFRELSKVKIEPKLKSKPRGKVRKNGTLIEYYGVITSIESKYGFIKINNVQDEVYFYRYEKNKDYLNWDKFRQGDRVSFYLGFNYKGAIAINVKLIN